METPREANDADSIGNKTIDPTSGFRLTNEEKGKMPGNDGQTNASVSRAADVERIPIPDFRTIDSSSLDGFAYKSEGNATFVVSLPRERKVLRFRKSDPERGDEPADDGGKTRVRLIVDFHKNVISGLMGCYASEPEIVIFNPLDLSRISILEADRPEHRRHKKVVVETFATTLPDYTLLSEYLHKKLPSGEGAATFCVEIKPKQGFVENDISMIRGKCDYCRKQYSKVAGGKISTASNYCPCDLFSGQADRMRRAVRGLADAPQNNFRIFKNGESVYGEGFEPDDLDGVLAEWLYDEKPFEKEKALDTMFELIREALLRPFPGDQPHLASSHSPKVSLPRDSVLGKILRVQRLNNHGIDFVHRIYSTYSNILDDEIIYTKTKPIQDKETSESVPSEEELLILRNYLLFRVAKDCSIMIAFRKIDPSAISSVPSVNVIRISSSRYFLFNNAVTDLDPKSVHSIEKHYRQKSSEIFKVAARGHGSESVLVTGIR